MWLEAFVAAGIALGTPILLAALGELLVERAGVLNIGLEGVLLFGAFVATVAASATGSASAGVLAAALVGVLTNLIFALATIRWGADQILVGTALNLLALGGTGALYRALYGATGAALVLPTLPALDWAWLRTIPWVGSVLADQHILVLVGLLLTPSIAFLLRRTGAGLMIRALGDQPLAAASLGIPVRRVRTLVLAASGALAGAGGAVLCLASASTFVEGISAGRGFIALAVVVLGRWSALGILLGSLLFGFASALQFQLQAAALQVPYQVFLTLPYALTLAVLAIFGGTDRAPRALGAPLEEE
jgi:general nucleoside transport system permease protein